MEKSLNAGNTQRRREHALAFVAFLLLLAVLVTSHAVSGAMARYTTSGSSSDEARVALFGHSETINFGDGWASDLKPGDSRTVTLEVTNASNGKVSEVAQAYSIEVETAGNLPLEFTLSQGDVAINESSSNTDAKTGFKTHVFATDDMAFTAGAKSDTAYELTVSWPEGSKAVKNTDVPDFVQVNINVKQID